MNEEYVLGLEEQAVKAQEKINRLAEWAHKLTKEINEKRDEKERLDFEIHNFATREANKSFQMIKEARAEWDTWQAQHEEELKVLALREKQVEEEEAKRIAQEIELNKKENELDHEKIAVNLKKREAEDKLQRALQLSSILDQSASKNSRDKKEIFALIQSAKVLQEEVRKYETETSARLQEKEAFLVQSQNIVARERELLRLKEVKLRSLEKKIKDGFDQLLKAQEHVERSN